MLEAADIAAARKRLEGAIYQTPCPYSQTLSELSGARCFVKLENLQMTGSFKERGAANLLLQLDPAEVSRGVAAASAGNHGLAVAFHAARLGIRAVIVMPGFLSSPANDRTGRISVRPRTPLTLIANRLLEYDRCIFNRP